MSASGRILTGKVHAHNTFDAPDNIGISDFAVGIRADGIEFNMPECSVVSIEIITK